MDTRTDKITKEQKESIATYTKQYTALSELLAELKKWPNKLVDKKFFEREVFALRDENGQIQKRYDGTMFLKYAMGKGVYSWQKNKAVLYYAKTSIDLLNKETTYVISAVQDEMKILKNHITKLENRIAKLSTFDEEAFMDDMRALYKKYSKPEHWHELLDEVKYI